ncbi:hypothetical protein C0995_014286, partial [Termitomyces sp. Mi166
MVPKISLLNVSPDACLLEREHAAQKFIVAADAVFLKAQGLAMLVPLHEMAFGLLEALADSRQVSWKHAISTIEQIKLMHFEKMVIELESSVPMVALQPIVNLAPTPVSTTSSIQHAPSVPYIADPSSPPMHMSLPRFSALATFLIVNFLASLRVVVTGAGGSSCRSAPQNKGKGKAKATEDDNNDKKTAQKLRKELEDFIVPTT